MRKASLDMVHEMARRDPRVVFVGSDLGVGTLDKMKAEMPERFFMEGVAEQNIIGLAAGLAMEGFIPYVNTIATFLTRRCYEQVAIDLCLHKLPVRLIASGGGVVYAPLGPTHLATEDLAIMRAQPNMTVVAPSDAEEMRRLMPATLDHPGPVYIRLGKGGDPVISRPENGFSIGKGIVLRQGGDVALLSTGIMSGHCLAAAEALAQDGVQATVLHLHTVKPLDVETVVEVAASCRLLVTIEEHAASGGLGSAVTEALIDQGGPLLRLKRLGFADTFFKNYGTQDDLLRDAGLMPDQITQVVRQALKDL